MKIKRKSKIVVKDGLCFVSLTRGKVAVCDQSDREFIEGRFWFTHDDGGRFYARTHVYVEGKRFSVGMHRIVLGLSNSKSAIDHIDHDGLNNRRANLRVCTQRENTFNRRLNKNSSSGIKGVYLHKASGKWRAQIQVDRKKKYLGVFGAKEDAASAYKAAAVKFFGEFASL